MLAWRPVGGWVKHHQSLVVWFTTVALFLVLFGYVDHLSYGRCEDRRHNVDVANSGYRRLVALERHNQFVNAKIRADRVSIYESMVYALPKC